MKIVKARVSHNDNNCKGFPDILKGWKLKIIITLHEVYVNSFGTSK